MLFFPIIFLLLLYFTKSAISQLLKKSDRDEDVDSDHVKDKSDNGETDRGKWDKTGGQTKPKDKEK